MEFKECSICKENKNLKDFSKNSLTKDKLDQRCKNCVNNTKNTLKEKQIDNVELLEKPILDDHICDIISKEWQGGKPFGTIFQRKGSNIWSVKVGTKSKTFNPKDYDGDDDKAYNEAKKWQKEISETLLKTKNKYKIVHDESGKPLYLIVQLTDNYVTLCDFEDLDFIKKNSLFSTHSGSSTKRYCAFSFNYKIIFFHRGKLENIQDDKVVDHLDRFPLDNRKSNLLITTVAENNKNKNVSFTSSVMRIKNENLFKANIDYGINGKRYSKIEYFDNKVYAKNWIRKEMRLINKIETFDSKKLELYNSYLEIMQTHAPEFKYQDIDESEHDDKDNSLTIKKNETEKEHSIITKKEEIFKKYHALNPEYDITKHLSNGNKLDHIEDGDEEYKYCTKCDKWKSINKYYSNKKNYDFLDRFCKVCKNISSENSTIKWKEENKDKIKEYNAKYREINGSSYKRIDEDKKKNNKLLKRKTYFNKFLSYVSQHKGGICLSKEEDYENAHSHLTVQCCNGHKWNITLNNISKGKWCKECHLKK